MYRVKIFTKGEYNNTTLGNRYCFRRKSAMKLINICLNSKCKIAVEKLVRLSSDVFAWTDTDDDKIFDYFNEKLWEEAEKDEEVERN